MLAHSGPPEASWLMARPGGTTLHASDAKSGCPDPMIAGASLHRALIAAVVNRSRRRTGALMQPRGKAVSSLASALGEAEATVIVVGLERPALVTINTGDRRHQHDSPVVLLSSAT